MSFKTFLAGTCQVLGISAIGLMISVLALLWLTYFNYLNGHVLSEGNSYAKAFTTQGLWLLWLSVVSSLFWLAYAKLDKVKWLSNILEKLLMVLVFVAGIVHYLALS